MIKLRQAILDYHIDILVLLIICFILPIAHVTAVQNLFFGLFVIVYFIIDKNVSFYKLLKIRDFLFIFSSFMFVALISIYYSINSVATMSALRGELFKPFILLVLVFLFISRLNDMKLKYIYMGFVFIFIFHTTFNIYTWYEHGLWPFRAGGLLDNGGGERFGIWATYAFAFSISLFFTKYLKLAYILFFMSIISIIANNTRATFIGMILIIFAYFIYFYKNKIIKYSSLFILLLSLTGFVLYSKNFNTRYNFNNIFSSIQNITKYTPSNDYKLMSECKLGNSTVARLSMWKSIILYRLKDPFTPQGYGRFLYGKTIVKLNQNTKENIPYKVYSQAHNDYMTIFFSLGIVGLLIFLYFLFYLLKINYFIFKYSKIYKQYAVFVFLGTLGFMASMMFGSFFGDSEKIYFYILYGISLALYLKTKEEMDAKT